MSSVLLPLPSSGSDRLAADIGTQAPASNSDLIAFTQAMSDANPQAISDASASSNSDANSNTQTTSDSDTDVLLAQLGTTINLTVTAKIPEANSQIGLADLVMAQTQDLKNQAGQSQELDTLQDLDNLNPALQNQAKVESALPPALANSAMVLIGENLKANLIKLGQTQISAGDEISDQRLMLQIMPGAQSEAQTNATISATDSRDLLKALDLKSIIFNPQDNSCEVQIRDPMKQTDDCVSDEHNLISLKAEILAVQPNQMEDVPELPKTIVFHSLNENSPLYRIEIIAQSSTTSNQSAQELSEYMEAAQPALDAPASKTDLSKDLGQDESALFTQIDSSSSTKKFAQKESIDSAISLLVGPESLVQASRTIEGDKIEEGNSQSSNIPSNTDPLDEAHPVSISVFLVKAVASPSEEQTGLDQSSNTGTEPEDKTIPLVTHSSIQTDDKKSDLSESSDTEAQIIVAQSGETIHEKLSEDKAADVAQTAPAQDVTGLNIGSILLLQPSAASHSFIDHAAPQGQRDQSSASPWLDQQALIKAQILLAQSQQRNILAPSSERLSQMPILQADLQQSATRQQLSPVANRSFVNPNILPNSSSEQHSETHAAASILQAPQEIKAVQMNAVPIEKLATKSVEIVNPHQTHSLPASAKSGLSEELIHTLDQMNGSIQVTLADPHDSDKGLQPNASTPSMGELGQRDLKPDPSQSDTNAASRQTRSLTAEIRFRALERQVINAAQANHDEVRMQLYPPGLGMIVIKLTMDGSKLTMKTRASHAEAVEALNALESDLKTSLSGHGIELTGFAVSDKDPDADRRQKDTPNQEDKVVQSVTAGAFALDLNA